MTPLEQSMLDDCDAAEAMDTLMLADNGWTDADRERVAEACDARLAEHLSALNALFGGD